MIVPHSYVCLFFFSIVKLYFISINSHGNLSRFDFNLKWITSICDRSFALGIMSRSFHQKTFKKNTSIIFIKPFINVIIFSNSCYGRRSTHQKHSNYITCSFIIIFHSFHFILINSCFFSNQTFLGFFDIQNFWFFQRIRWYIS